MMYGKNCSIKTKNSKFLDMITHFFVSSCQETNVLESRIGYIVRIYKTTKSKNNDITKIIDEIWIPDERMNERFLRYIIQCYQWHSFLIIGIL